MLAFIAWTPLHIINILNTKVNYYDSDKADLYIYNEFKNADIIYSNLLDLSVFENVYYVDHRMMGGFIKSKFNILFNKNKMLTEAEPFSYDTIFTQGGNYFLKILYSKSKMNNPDLELKYIEDGMVSYSSADLTNISTFRKYILNIVNPYSMFKDTIQEYYIYRPEAAGIKKKNDVKVLPKINADNKVYNILKKVFNYNEEKISISDALIFFDQPIIDKSLKKIEHLVFNHLKESNSNLLVKIHPRTSPQKYDEKYILQTSLPWEIFCIVNDISNVTTVSMYSTASVNASIMFDLNIKTVLLTKMFVDDPKYYSLISKNNKLRMKMNDLYKVTEKYESMNFESLELPKSEEEFISYIKNQ